jgi:Holliday junction resolvasome RuvABC endonuclease subunit
MILFALDLAERVGFAYGEPADDPTVKSGVYVLPKTGLDIGQYLVAFDDWFRPMLEFTKADRVIFEATILVPGNSVQTARKLMALAGFTEYACKRAGIRCNDAPIKTVKQYFAGHGNATKAEMIAAAEGRGFDVVDDNQADALAVWHYSASRFVPTMAISAEPLFRGG